MYVSEAGAICIPCCAQETWGDFNAVFYILEFSISLSVVGKSRCQIPAAGVQREPAWVTVSYTPTDSQTERDWHRQSHRQRDSDRQSDRQRETYRDSQRERERARKDQTERENTQIRDKDK